MKKLVRFCIGLVTTLFGGYVFSHLWSWFIVRKFAGVPTLSALDSVGVICTVSFLLLGIRLMDARKDAIASLEKNTLSSDGAELAWDVVELLVVYPLFFGIAYIYHLVIGN